MALIKPAPAEAVDALSKARVKLMLRKDCAFFTTLILQSPIHWVTEDEVATAATNGIDLFVNPDFLIGLAPEERIFLLLHEIMHNVYEHPVRAGFRDHGTWNEACDYVINDELIQRGFTMPAQGLHNVDYRGMNADEVYEDLIQRKNQGKSNTPTPWPDLHNNASNSGNGATDPNAPPSVGIGGMNVPTPQQVQDYNKNLLTQAVQASRMSGEGAGCIPGNIERALDNMLNPKLPWNKILARYLFSIAKNDYSYRRPNRRFISQGIFLPSLHSEGIGRIDFAIDTSGSVSEDDFNRFISELAFVFKTFNPQEIGVMQFDSILQSNDRVCSLQEFKKLEFKGGGGTQIEPVLEAFKESSGKALIILTDGGLYHGPELDPKKPVVWCIYDNPRFVPEFGTAIHFSKD